jgi:exosortase family protein XrtG
MTWPLLSALSILYMIGILWARRKDWHLTAYIWGSFGLAFLIIHLSLLQGWDFALAAAEASQVRALAGIVGLDLQIVDANTLLVPDPTGWSGLRIGVECSTLIEISVYAGLMVFYPRFSPRERAGRLIVGVLSTYGLNLIRIFIIIGIVMIAGKPAVPFAHAIIGRLIYFGGVIMIYWYQLTRPTLALIRQNIQASGRAAQ